MMRLQKWVRSAALIAAVVCMGGVLQGCQSTAESGGGGDPEPMLSVRPTLYEVRRSEVNAQVTVGWFTDGGGSGDVVFAKDTHPFGDADVFVPAGEVLGGFKLCVFVDVTEEGKLTDPMHATWDGNINELSSTTAPCE